MHYHPKFSGCLNLNFKINIMKKIIGAIFIFPFLLASCLKDPTINSDGKLSTGKLIEMPYSGLENVGKDAVIAAGVTGPIVVPILINVASADGKALDKDVTITLGIDDAARTAYNGNAANVVKFDALPDSGFSFVSKTGVLKAGQFLDTINIMFYPDKIDPSKNYMAAVTSKDAQGQRISANFSTHYFHFIGNPLAGNYTQEWIRYNSVGMTGTPVYDVTSAAVFAPISPTMISVASGTGTVYDLSFDNNGGVLSNFQIVFEPKSTDGITITSGPTIVKADPINNLYEFNFGYLNGSGKARNITDKFSK